MARECMYGVGLSRQQLDAVAVTDIASSTMVYTKTLRAVALLMFVGAVLTVPATARGTDADGDPEENILIYSDPELLYELLEDPPDDFFLVDTRTTEEYESGHIPGAIHRDYREIGNALPTENREAFVVVYCLSGVRSNRAARTLLRLGFTRVLDWGGIVDWPYEVTKGSEP